MSVVPSPLCVFCLLLLSVFYRWWVSWRGSTAHSGDAVALNGMGGDLRLLPDVVLEALVSNRVLPGDGEEMRK